MGVPTSKIRYTLENSKSPPGETSRPLWIPDTSIWLNHLGTIKRWIKTNNVTLVLTQSAIDGLDQFKKGVALESRKAREATRYIEQVLSEQRFADSNADKSSRQPPTLIAQRPEQYLGSWVANSSKYLVGNDKEDDPRSMTTNATKN